MTTTNKYAAYEVADKAFNNAMWAADKAFNNAMWAAVSREDVDDAYDARRDAYAAAKTRIAGWTKARRENDDQRAMRLDAAELDRQYSADNGDF